MKKLMSTILVGTLVLSFGALSFADTSTDCDLSSEEFKVAIEIKTEFLDDQVASEELTQIEADAILKDLEAQLQTNVMEGLFFGKWFRDSDHDFDSLSHKNTKGSGLEDGNGYKGNNSEDAGNRANASEGGLGFKGNGRNK